METIGKVLSLTLLTIFGSAAGAIYLVESDFFPEFIEKTPIIYSSDSSTSKETVRPEIPKETVKTEYRMRRSETYYEVSAADSYDEGRDKDALWTQSYDAKGLRGSSDRAQYLASVNSLSALQENLEHWQRQYKNARENGQKRTASLAYSNFKDYQRAIDIKTNTGSN